jgi:FtsP/CotA-like multicopper oxidase with cupredoxin domain
MADGRPLYIFSFHNVNHLLEGLTPDPQDPYGIVQVPLSDLMMDGMLQAEFPASLIRARQGQKVYANLVNVGMAIRPDLFDPHTIHFHGFPNASAVFDGVPDASISVNMMANLTYFYNISISPGTYMYHCHVEATEHMQMGMLGNLFVEPLQNQTGYDLDGDGLLETGEGEDDAQTVSTLSPNASHPDAPGGYAYNDGDGSTAFDVDYPIQIGSFDPDFHDSSLFVQPLPFAFMVDKYPLLNGRGYPDTLLPDNVGSLPVAQGGKPGLLSQRMSSLIEVNQGEKILLRLSTLSVTRFYTLACSLPMKVVGQDAQHLRSRTTGENLYFTTYSLTLGGGTAYDAIIDTTGVEPGTYLLYTTNLQYLTNNVEPDTDGAMGGMVTEIRVQ